MKKIKIKQSSEERQRRRRNLENKNKETSKANNRAIYKRLKEGKWKTEEEYHLYLAIKNNAPRATFVRGGKVSPK